MAIIKHRKLTHNVFLKETFFEYRKINQAKAKLDKLQDEYIGKFCEFKVGQEITLPDGAHEGFSKFTIEKIRADIQDGKGKGSYFIEFVYEGTYSGEGMEEKKGTLKFNHIKKETPTA